MTIVVHYRRLQQLLKLKPDEALAFHLSSQMRQQIRHYRLQQLQQHQPDLDIGQHLHGKPISLNSALQFNHSHSQQSYALVYSEDVDDLGVDIEDVQRPLRMNALAQRYFHPEELHRWQMTGFDREFWFKVWTIKEAVLKAHGLGIRLQLNSLNSHAHPTWDFGMVEHAQLGQFVYQSQHLADAMCTVAYRKPLDFQCFEKILIKI